MRVLMGVWAGVLALAFADGAMADAPAGGMAAKIVLPGGDDEFARLAAQAASGDAATDFRALRLAYLKSAQHKAMNIAAEDQLRRDMQTAHENYEWQREFDTAVKLLSAKFIDMDAYKGLDEACLKLRDYVCSRHAGFMKINLLQSIMRSGNGHDCAKGFEVISADEETYMMSLLHARDVKRAAGDAPACERLDLDAGGESKTWYFRRADLAL